MIGAVILGFIAGTIGRLIMPDAFNNVEGIKSWILSTAVGIAGALLGWLIFTQVLNIGDDDIFDFGGIVGAIVGVMILLPILGFVMKRRNKA